ncbi:MAG: hypothetical protein AB7O56_11845 [Bauldia sp.]
MKRAFGLKPAFIMAGALVAALAVGTLGVSAQQAAPPDQITVVPVPRPVETAPAVEAPAVDAAPVVETPAAGVQPLAIDPAAAVAPPAAEPLPGAPLAAEGVPAGPALGPEPLNFLPNAARTEPLDLLPIPTPADPGAMPPATQEFVLTALLAEGGTPIPDGLDWRVFGPQPGPDGQLPLVAEATGGIARVMLAPGEYYLHAAYGRAGATARIEVGPANNEETIVLNAGGLRLGALVGDDIPIPPDDLRFEVYVDTAAGERALVADAVPPDQIVRLNAGAYHVVSYYGTTNAIVRADIRVDAAQLTEVTLYHQAARVTLKLVTTRGGEALANTAWSVMSAGGEIVFDSVGAFPTVVLAAGDYTAIARHNDLIFESPFTIVSAQNRDVEVLAENPITPEP